MREKNINLSLLSIPSLDEGDWAASFSGTTYKKFKS